jgi:hypothetical protein
VRFDDLFIARDKTFGNRENEIKLKNVRPNVLRNQQTFHPMECLEFLEIHHTIACSDNHTLCTANENGQALDATFAFAPCCQIRTFCVPSGFPLFS